MARVTAEGLQIGTKARGLGAGALGLAGQRGDVARVLGGGSGERSGIGLGGAQGRRGIQPGGVALRPEVPGNSRREQQRAAQRERHGVPAEQREDRRAHQG
ncbi:hypothetical protein GXW74_22475 [Roseomonas eburnea]|uniref:Uncharacterized protein n=1 Tax=Neoroseomonas eburnea TaxID=1346889 RepID=A0A9X9XHT3_9PROT|nr:hypothetical protein [Neoroseomonas eburnea]MBR0683269.1 hypothetical protein [Neoroseomonas eburnea]